VGAGGTAAEAVGNMDCSTSGAGSHTAQSATKAGHKGSSKGMPAASAAFAACTEAAAFAGCVEVAEARRNTGWAKCGCK